jgi:ABC-type antimicrobial peptide transport system permease subunit
VVPAFGDAESVRWILHSGLGGTIERTTSRGPVALRFDGLLAFSIFAGEILVSEERFHAMFPEVSAPSMFLIRGLSRNTRALAEALRRNLGDAGIEVRETRDILSDLLAVQNTYLAAFLVLGGLGIVLGTVGLGAVMLRTAAERRSEFALMAALGFVRTAIARMMAQESAALLLSGAVLGTLTALIGSLPRVLSGEASVNWAALGVALASIVVVGLGSCVAAAAAATRGDLQAGLRAE